MAVSLFWWNFRGFFSFFLDLALLFEFLQRYAVLRNRKKNQKAIFIITKIPLVKTFYYFTYCAEIRKLQLLKQEVENHSNVKT